MVVLGRTGLGGSVVSQQFLVRDSDLPSPRFPCSRGFRNMASAQVLAVDMAERDGGLGSLLVKSGLDARVIVWLTGMGDADQGIDSLRTFVSSFVIADYERDIDSRVRSSNIPGIGNIPREINRAVALLRVCFHSAVIASAAPPSSAAPSSSAALPTAPPDLDAPSQEGGP